MKKRFYCFILSITALACLQAQNQNVYNTQVLPKQTINTTALAKAANSRGGLAKKGNGGVSEGTPILPPAPDPKDDHRKTIETVNATRRQ